MNDTHDYAYTEEQLDSWKKEHLNLLMCRRSEAWQLDYGAGKWSAVDYTYREVRQKVYNIIKDVAVRYDVDGIELDFTRFLTYFKEVMLGEDLYEENLERMNNLIRSIRDMTETVSAERGKPILISVYIPDSVGYCKALGLDVETWHEEGLVDIVAAGCHSGRVQSWSDTVKEYEKYDVPVYAALDPLTYNSGYETDFVSEAALAWKAGVDGIYTYNLFDPSSEIFDKMGSYDTCGDVAADYKTTANTIWYAYLKNTSDFAKDIND